MAPRILSPLQRRRIQQAIRDGHLAFLAEVFGPTAIDADDYDRLRAAGKIRGERLMPQDAALAAHAIGAIAGHEQADGPSGDGSLLSAPDEFWQHVRDDPQVITEAEREAVTVIRDRVAQYVRGLGDGLDAAVGHILIDVDDEARKVRLVRGAADERASKQVVIERVRVAINNLRRDWLRVAHTELHNAAESAKAVVLAGRDPAVFKRPHPDACAFCKLLYLKPDGLTPRVFRLSALIANGTNVGRRARRPTRSGRSRTEWKPVLGAVHPFCRCSMSVLPGGMGFDAHGQMVYVGVKKSVSVEAIDKDLVNHTCEE